MSRLKPRPPKGIRIAIFRYFDQGLDLAFAASFSLTAFVLAEGTLLFYRMSKGVFFYDAQLAVYVAQKGPTLS